MSGRGLPIIAVSLILGGFADALQAEQSAVAYVESIYADRESPGGTARYSPRLDKLWAECEERAKAAGDACMDYSMIVMGNDALLTDVKIEQKQSGPGTAVVEAHFKNLGTATTVTYDLVHDSEGWAIDEMTSGCTTLSGVLKDEPPKC
jgi:hypothetical protein